LQSLEGGLDAPQAVVERTRYRRHRCHDRLNRIGYEGLEGTQSRLCGSLGCCGAGLRLFLLVSRLSFLLALNRK